MGRLPDPQFTDIDRLIAPISADRPCGDWLRYEGTYEQIRDARREDDASLPQGVWQTELKQANWGAVESLCAQALAGRSKDLQLATWLLEAWILLDSFAGAARGIELMHRLCSEFWQDMFPALGDDLAPRLAPIQWINDKLSRRVRLLRLTQPSMEDVPAYSLADWDVALRNAGGPSTTGVTLSKFQQSVALTPRQWLVSLNGAVNETLAQVQGFDEFLDEKAGKLAPGLTKFRTEVSSVAQLLETMLEATRGSEPETPEQAEGELALQSNSQGNHFLAADTLGSGDARPAMPPAGITIRSRAEAYRLLEEIAEFLHQNDPHSPTPYLIWRAVSWETCISINCFLNW